VTLRAAHLFALAGVACAQPLYDILGRNPEFFAAHGATRVEIVAFALAVLLVPPSILFAIELAANATDVRLGTVLHVGFVGALAGLLALQAIRRLNLSGGWAVALGVAAAAARPPPTPR
jgi:hypothetical protein